MKPEIQEVKSPFTAFSLRGGCLRKRGRGIVSYAPFLTGMVVLLGLTIVPSTSSFAHPADVATTVKTIADFTSRTTTTTVITEGAVSATTTDTSITTSGTVIGERTGVFVSQEGDGDVNLTNVANIGAADYGIEVTHGGTGDFHIVNRGSITGVEYGGISAAHLSDGALDIHSSGRIGAGDWGIHSRHNGQGKIDIDFSGTITAEGNGIYASHRGSGFLSITSNTANNTVNANSEIVSLRRGIVARHDGTGEIHLQLSAKGRVVSKAREGIFVEHGGTGHVSLFTSSQISGYDSGILINHNGDGSVDLDISNRVEGHFSGVFVNHQGPSVRNRLGSSVNHISVNPGGSVYAIDGDAIRVRSPRNGVHIDIEGPVSSATGKAIDVVGSYVELRLYSASSLNGKVVATSSSGDSSSNWVYLSSYYSDDVLDFDKVEFNGFSLFFVLGSRYTPVMTGTISGDDALSGMVIREEANVRFSDVHFKSLEDLYIWSSNRDTGTLEIVGSNRLGGNLDNDGRIVFALEGKDDLLTITGNYITGDYNLGELVFRVNLEGGWDNDKLVVEGNFVGSRPVRVSIITPETGYPLPALPSSPVLIEVKGEAQAGDFEGNQVVGPYRYVLGHEVADNVNRWRFHKRELSSTTAPLSLMAPMLSELSKTPALDLSEDESSGLGFRDEFRRHAGSIWAEQQGSRTSLKQRTITGSHSRMEDNRVHFGFNTSPTILAGGDLVLGASMSQGFSTSEVSSPIGSGSIGVESHAAGLTASWWSPEGFYVDVQTRHVRFSSDISAERVTLVRDNEGTSVSASVGTGYRFAVPLGGVNFQVVPQAQLVWSRVDFDDFIGPHSELVSLEDGDLMTGRLGLSWDGEWHDARGMGRVYGGINLRGAVDGRTAVNISGLTLASEQRGLSADGRLGVSYEWDEGYAVRGEVMALHRDDAEEVRANLGMSIHF